MRCGQPYIFDIIIAILYIRYLLPLCIFWAKLEENEWIKKRRNEFKPKEKWKRKPLARTVLKTKEREKESVCVDKYSTRTFICISVACIIRASLVPFKVYFHSVNFLQKEGWFSLTSTFWRGAQAKTIKRKLSSRRTHKHAHTEEWREKQETKKLRQRYQRRRRWWRKEKSRMKLRKEIYQRR